MALHGALEAGEQRLQRGTAHLARIERQLSATAHRLLERMRTIAMQRGKIGRELGEERLARVPAFGRLEDLGGDEPRVIVQYLVARIAAQPPCRRPQRDGM